MREIETYSLEFRFSCHQAEKRCLICRSEERPVRHAFIESGAVGQQEDLGETEGPGSTALVPKHLARLVPEPIVRWMYFTGTRLPASALQAWGGVIGVVERSKLLDQATAVAAQIAAYSPTAVRLSKRGLNDIEFLDTKRGYELEQGLTVRMSSTDASAKKRRPADCPVRVRSNLLR